MSAPGFDRPVPANGYAWWYVDAVSDDGRHGLTIIAFIGSVFSPYYHHARRYHSAGVNAADHCAINIALYGPRGRWAMTERGRAMLEAGPDTLTIGPSSARWQNDRLVFDLDEHGSPLPRRIRGQVRVTPQSITAHGYALDPAERHHWQPIAPVCDIEVRLDVPRLSWRGRGYLDHNHGARALEDDFNGWDWARAAGSRGTTIHYDVTARDGTDRALATHIASDGSMHERARGERHRLAATRIWRMPRHGRSDEGRPTILRTLEDTPFYSRSELAATLDGEATHGMHESLSLTRFQSPWVRTMLRCRMPRESHRDQFVDRSHRSRR